MAFVPVGESVHVHARRAPDRNAITATIGPSVTYAQLDQRSSQLARALLAQGLTAGDRIAAWLGNRTEYVELYLAAAKARLTLVPINERARAGEVRHQLDETEPRVIVIDDRSSEEFAQLSLDPGDIHTVECGLGSGMGQSYDELLDHGPDSGTLPRPDAADVLVIAYTSGTTGRPKGAMLSHAAFKSAIVTCAAVTGLPLYSVGVHAKSISLVGAVPGSVFAHLYLGGRLVLLDKWDTDEVFHRAKGEHANFINIATPKIHEIIQTIEADPTVLHSVRTIMRSGIGASPDQVAELVGAVGDRYVTGWGMTENSGAFVTATSSADHDGPGAIAMLATAGKPVAETSVRLVDTDELSIEDEGVGELVVTSPNLMSGYWRRPEETARALHDGWYRTGDVGTIDSDGFVHLVDRRTDLIVSGGMNIYPREIENVVAEIPGVVRCVVVGAPHPQWGRTPVAIVTARPGSAVSELDIINAVRDQLASYKKPTAVLFRSDLPENLSGKVMRAELGAWATEQLKTHPPSGQ